jgi:hypothetical protein
VKVKVDVADVSGVRKAVDGPSSLMNRYSVIVSPPLKVTTDCRVMDVLVEESKVGGSICCGTLATSTLES